MAPVLTCELCITEPRLRLPVCYAWLVVLHTVSDHEWPVERVARCPRRAT